MNVLIIGSGGREHALANSLRKSARLDKLYVAPGNPGIAAVAENVLMAVDDHGAVVDFCRLMTIDLVVVGPEAPLVAGLVDALTEAGIPAFGPTKAAAQLEGSKGFTKDLCRRCGIPTAAYERFTNADAALAYVRAKGAPIVVKADGLAAGKGVVVAVTLDEAEAAIASLLHGRFGVAGSSLVIEEFLDGEEVSFFALCDGRTAIPFASAQDHKRLLDGDQGPNTGGMGAYSPAPIMDTAMTARVMREIVMPTLAGMADAGMPFRGVLFAGLMIGRAGPRLIEFNVRFGDPETQVMLPRVEGDLLSLLLACAEGRLGGEPPALADRAALTVVLAAPGYPDAPEAGSEIKGLDSLGGLENVVVTHAGTKRRGAAIVANGGRVLNVTGLGKTLMEARWRAYDAIERLDWPQAQYRRDIGARGMAAESDGTSQDAILRKN